MGASNEALGASPQTIFTAEDAEDAEDAEENNNNTNNNNCSVALWFPLRSLRSLR